MTINPISSSYLQSIYGGLGASTSVPPSSLAVPPTLSGPAPAQPVATPIGTVLSSDPGPVPSGTPVSATPWMPGPPNPRLQAIVSQLQQSDPALAQKLQGFQSQVQNLQASGASQSTIATTVQNDISSLTTQQQTELQQAAASIKHHHHHGHGGGGGSDSLLNALTSTSSTTDASATTDGVANANSAIASLFGANSAQSQGLASYLQAQMATADQSLFGLAA